MHNRPSIAVTELAPEIVNSCHVLVGPTRAQRARLLLLELLTLLRFLGGGGVGRGRGGEREGARERVVATMVATKVLQVWVPAQFSTQLSTAPPSPSARARARVVHNRKQQIVPSKTPTNSESPLQTPANRK